MPLESFLPTQRRNGDITPSPSTEPEKNQTVSARNRYILRNFSATIAALGYASGITYMIFRHREISEGAIASAILAASTIPAVISAELHNKTKSR